MTLSSLKEDVIYSSLKKNRSSNNSNFNNKEGNANFRCGRSKQTRYVDNSNEQEGGFFLRKRISQPPLHRISEIHTRGQTSELSFKRALSVMSEIRQRVKLGGETLWRSAVYAAGNAVQAAGEHLQKQVSEHANSSALLNFNASNYIPFRNVVESIANNCISSSTRSNANLNPDYDTAITLACKYENKSENSFFFFSQSNTWGKCNFKLSFRLLQIEEAGGVQCGRLIAECWPLSKSLISNNLNYYSVEPTNVESKGLPLPCVFNWFRRYEYSDSLFSVSGVSGNIYQISVDDVGASIVVEAILEDTPENADYWGTAYGILGPFEVDFRSLCIIHDGIVNGSLRFPIKKKIACTEIARSENVECVASEKSGERNDANGVACCIDKPLSTFRKKQKNSDGWTSENNNEEHMIMHILNDELRILLPGPMNNGFSRKWCTKYTTNHPKIELEHNNPHKFAIYLSNKTDDKLLLEAYSRHQRDLITLAVRCFRSISFASTHLIVNSLICDNHNQDSDNSALNLKNNQINLFCVLYKLLEELNKYKEKSDRVFRERNKAILEKNALEEEMTSTIRAFQVQLDETQSDVNIKLSKLSSVTNMESVHKLNELQERLKHAENLNSKYSLEIIKLKQHKDLHSSADDNNFCTKEANSSNLSKKDIDFSRKKVKNNSKEEKIKQLNIQIELLTNQLELMRLEKENCQKELYTAKREKVDLKLLNMNEETHDDLLLKLKNLQADNEKLAQDSSIKLDKKQKEVESYKKQCANIDNELQRLSRSYDNITVERNRLSKLVNSLSKDLDKSRNQNEVKVNKLVISNEQLVKENEKLKIDLNLLKEQLDRQIRTTNENNYSDAPRSVTVESESTVTSSQDDLRAQIIELKNELNKKESLLKRLEEENVSLKSRIRKLAKNT